MCPCALYSNSYNGKESFQSRIHYDLDRIMTLAFGIGSQFS